MRGLVIGEIYQAVLRKVRMQLHIHEAGRGAEDGDGRDARDRCGVELAVADDAELSGALGDEGFAGRQEFDGARRVEATRDDGDAQLALFPRFKIERAVGEFRRGPGGRALTVRTVALVADAARGIGDAFDIGAAVLAGGVG